MSNGGRRLETDWNPLPKLFQRTSSGTSPNQMSSSTEGSTVEDLYYPTVELTSSRSIRGRALVLNYENFSHLEDGGARPGSRVDVEALVATFRDLHYQVLVHHDLSVAGTRAVLETEKRQVDHRPFDSFVLAILTHGREGDVLLCSDGEINEDLLIDSFTPDACPTLAGKPKMIFIQACRGRKLDAGYQLVVDGHGPGGSFPWSTSSSSALVPAKIPTHADFLVYRSTYAGHYSWRNSVNGSWFIQDLTGVLRRFAIQRSSSFDLMTLLTLVNREVAFKRQSRVPVDENDDDERKEMNGKKEMPVFSCTLTKLVRLSSPFFSERR